MQTSEDQFKVFIGPFKSHQSYNEAKTLNNRAILYRPDFWSFLQVNQSLSDYYTSEITYDFNRNEFIEFINIFKKNDEKTDSMNLKINWNFPDQLDFKKQYDWIKNQIKQGSITKALPIALQTGTGNIKIQLFKILNQILNVNENHLKIKDQSYAYGFWKNNDGMIGYTPELLCEWNKSNSEMQTMAVAGTWKKNLHEPHPNYDFADKKIIAEHQFVIQDIETQLNNFSLQEKLKTEVIELPFLFHLKTTFKYSCKSIFDYLKSIYLLHPTAALGLYPRSQEKFHIFSNMGQQSQRKNFGAPFGFVSENSAHMLVAIRSILWSKNKIELFAGCGVTSDSSFDAEWEEILAKQSSVQKMLGLD